MMLEVTTNRSILKEDGLLRRLKGIASYYKQTYEAVCVGVTVDYEKMAKHYSCVKDCHWEKMIVRYETEDYMLAKAVECLVAWKMPECAAVPNSFTEGKRYYIYVLMGWNVIGRKVYGEVKYCILIRYTFRVEDRGISSSG